MTKELTPEYYAKGIKAYAKQRETVRQVITEYGGRLHRDDFDKEFADYQRHERDWTEEEIASGKARGCKRVWMSSAKRHFGFAPMDDHTFILGSMRQGQWADWLDLTQHMVRAGELTAEIDGEDVWYCLPGGECDSE